MICSKCTADKLESDFTPDKRMKRGFHSYCKACVSAAVQKSLKKRLDEMTPAQLRAWQDNKNKKNVESKRRNYDAEKQKAYSLKYRYGLTLEDWRAMFDAQDGACAVCGAIEVILHVDHDHACCDGRKTCGECVRALVCWPCNLILGLADDSPARLLAASAYLDSMIS
jgi:hypothetical protein